MCKMSPFNKKPTKKSTHNYSNLYIILLNPNIVNYLKQVRARMIMNSFANRVIIDSHSMIRLNNTSISMQIS
jgi:hypothetical protein